MTMMNLMSAASQSEVAFPQDATLNPTALNSSEAFSPLMAFRSNPEPWVRDVHCSLESLRELGQNWDSYGALPAVPDSIKSAKAFIKLIGCIVGVERPDVSLSPAGNAVFSWETSNGKRNLDVEILKSGQMRFAFIDDDDESADIERETFDLAEIASILTQW
ncbi:MAG: hypothetical protein NT013_04165 [Planctomycetia bacterium]|nr:hypothetical protein [Planctomycetia bacterium]